MEDNYSRKKLLIIPLLLVVFVAVIIIVSTAKKEWTCDRCEKEWNGKAYYGSELSDTLCENCAWDYWEPLPIENYIKTNNSDVEADKERVTQTEETTTEALIREYSFTTVSDFNEGLACVRFYNNYCYINKSGEVQFLLPDGYDSGEPFYDGFAVIKKEKKVWSVVNRSGEIIIDGQKDNLIFISRASEGVICAIKEEQLYTGTFTYIVFYDYKGKVIKTIDATHLKRLSLGYFQFGTVGILESEDAWNKTYYYYDKTGNLVKTLKGLCSLQSDGQYTYSQYPSSLQKGEVFDRKNLKTVSKLERLIDDVAPKNAEFFAYRKYDKKSKTSSLVISDRNGKSKTYNIDGLDFLVKQTTRDDNRWIVQLQNNYYAIVDEKGSFIMEPVQSTIHYIGESMYFINNTKTVIDKDGNVLFSSLYDLRSHTNLYHDGMLKWGESYIDNKGNMLNMLKIKEEF